MERLEMAQVFLKSFITRLDDYSVTPPEEKKLFSKKSSSFGADPAKRRQIKIDQYKKEKEIRNKVQALAARRNHSGSSEIPANDLDLIASLLPSSAVNDSSSALKRDATDDDDDDDEDEDTLRATSLLLLRLISAQAFAQYESMDQELELLRSAPPPSSSSTTTSDARVQSEDGTWRLDRPIPTGGPDGRGPLLDPKGRPLRPFTIMPSAGAAADRTRLQAEVFRPDHRLPTMSIDEYLEGEKQRGNIITGGGQASYDAPTTSEQLQEDSERDGTRFGEEREEEKRIKDESWAQFTDHNPKGAGNTLNRG